SDKGHQIISLFSRYFLCGSRLSAHGISFHLGTLSSTFLNGCSQIFPDLIADTGGNHLFEHLRFDGFHDGTIAVRNLTDHSWLIVISSVDDGTERCKLLDHRYIIP